MSVLFNKIAQWSKAKGAERVDSRILANYSVNTVKLLILGTKNSKKT